MYTKALSNEAPVDNRGELHNGHDDSMIFYVCIYVYIEIHIPVGKASQCTDRWPLSIPQPQDMKFLF